MEYALSIASFSIYNYIICITGALYWDCNIIIYNCTVKDCGSIHLKRQLQLSSRTELVLEVLLFLVVHFTTRR